MSDSKAVSEHEIQLVIALPLKLIEQVEDLVERGYARNRDALLAAAVESFTSKLEERAAIDSEFMVMATDAEFQSLNLKISEEFAGSDYQALKDSNDEAG